MSAQSSGRRAVPVARRRFLAGAVALGGLALGCEPSSNNGNPDSSPKPEPPDPESPDSESPFTLGVASGEPRPGGVVLWTRLAREPLDGGGMPRRDLEIEWEVAEDERFAKVIARGPGIATPLFAHSVHVAVNGLRPARWYWYRFRSGKHLSPVGRTRTAPAIGSSPDRFRFAFVSCQDYQAGLYTAYEHLAGEDVDLVVHLGDYIYEYGVRSGNPVRRHEGAEVTDLQGYRNRHALYRSDPHLQHAHAQFPWMVTWDDHEVANDYADAAAQEPKSPDSFLKRRSAAYRAYYEHMPLRRSSLPQGPDMRIYRRAQFGDLVHISMLDTRQYRSDQPCGGAIQPRCAEALSESQTMTGPAQERWLLQNLDRSPARWNIIGQQIMLAQFKAGNGAEALFNMDAWDGYAAARARLLAFMANRKPSNPVVITGDVHSSWVNDLETNFDDKTSSVVGTELVGPSISSELPPPFELAVEAARADNPHSKFFEGSSHGYVLCDVDRRRMRSDYRVVSDVTTPGAPVSTLASFEVADGRAGAHPG
ncbi:MAG: alkaline phosphatase D family protein [Actinobacteria bacterium]|nr:alkaline phosphatase D family protein [Actinomycetota bacterium]